MPVYLSVCLCSGFPKAETEAEESAEEGEEQLSAVGEELAPEDTEEIMRQREEQRLLDEHDELTNLLVVSPPRHTHTHTHREREREWLYFCVNTFN